MIDGENRTDQFLFDTLLIRMDMKFQQGLSLCVFELTTQSLLDLGNSIDFTEARLNRVVRLTKTLATIAGNPE